MGCSPWIPRNSSHRPQYDDTGASRHVESNTVEVLWVSAGFVATDFPSGPRPLPTHAQPACFPRPTKNSEEPSMGLTFPFCCASLSQCAAPPSHEVSAIATFLPIRLYASANSAALVLRMRPPLRFATEIIMSAFPCVVDSPKMILIVCRL